MEFTNAASAFTRPFVLICLLVLSASCLIGGGGNSERVLV